MHAAGRQRDHRVARLHRFVVNDLRLVHQTGAVAGQIVFVLGIEAGHLGGLAADQRRAGLHTALAHALDDLLDPLRNILSAGNIIQEKQRFRSAADNVVHAHGHAVDTDGVMFVHQKGQLQLCPDAVCAGNQHRPGNAAHIRLKQAAEAAHVGADTGRFRPADMLFHQFNSFVARGDIHARGGVRFRSGLLVHFQSSFPFQQ